MGLFEEFLLDAPPGFINLRSFRNLQVLAHVRAARAHSGRALLGHVRVLRGGLRGVAADVPRREGDVIELEKVYPMGLISNGPTDAQWFKIEKFHLDDIFDVILVSGQIGMAKPDPNIFYVAMAGIRSEPSNTVMVGNSLEHDFRGAMNADAGSCGRPPEGAASGGLAPAIGRREQPARAQAAVPLGRPRRGRRAGPVPLPVHRRVERPPRTGAGSSAG